MLLQSLNLSLALHKIDPCFDDLLQMQRSGFVDVSVFVLCVGKSDKDMLGEIDHFYQENRFKGMCVLLNGASQGRGYGSHYYTSQKS